MWYDKVFLLGNIGGLDEKKKKTTTSKIAD